MSYLGTWSISLEPLFSLQFEENLGKNKFIWTNLYWLCNTDSIFLCPAPFWFVCQEANDLEEQLFKPSISNGHIKLEQQKVAIQFWNFKDENV